MAAPLSRAMTRRRLLGAVGAASALAPVLAPREALAALFPDEGFWTFQARDAAGSPCGALSYRFARRPGVYEVSVESLWRLPPPGAGPNAGPSESASAGPWVRHGAEELWRDGWLYRLASRTRIGERRHRLLIERDDAALRGTRDGHAFSLSGYAVPSSLWHPETPRLPALLDSVTGRTRIIRGRRGAREWLRLGQPGAESVAATHWRIEGELRRELWYDDAGRLVRARLPDAAGGPLTLERQAG